MMEDSGGLNAPFAILHPLPFILASLYRIWDLQKSWARSVIL
jgi:hypothetical protein